MLLRLTAKLILALVIALAPVCAFASSYVIGVPADSPEMEGIQDWAPLAEYLTDTIPEAKFTIKEMPAREFAQALNTREIHFIIADPITFVTLSLETEIDRLATRNKKIEEKSHAKCGSAIFSLEMNIDMGKEVLRTKKIIAVHPDSLSGWLAAKREFHNLGLDLEKDFQNVEFAGSSTEVIRKIKSKKGDIGVVPGGELEVANKKGLIDLEKVKVHELARMAQPGCPYLISTRSYPDWAFAARKDIDHVFLSQVAVALLSMPADSPAAIALGSSGWTIGQDYEPVKDSMKQLCYGPYGKLKEYSVPRFMAEHRYWLIAFVVLVLILIVLSLLLMKAFQKERIASAQILEQLQEKHKAQEALKISEKNYKGIFEHVNDAIFIHDAKTGDIMESNHKAAEMFGFDDTKKADLTLPDICTQQPPFSVDDALKWIHECAKGGNQTFEWRSKKINGLAFWTEVSLQPMVLQGVPRVIAAIRDISERKKAEVALALSEERYRNIVENIAEGVAIVDLEENFIFVNSAMERIFGVSQGGLAGKGLMDFLDHKNFEIVQQQTKRRLLGEVGNYTISIQRSDDEVRSVMVTAGPRYGENSEVTGAYAIFHDNTEQKKLEKALADSEARLMDFLDNAHDLIQSSNLQGQFLFVNKKWKKVMGYSDDEIKNLGMLDIVHPDNREEMAHNYSELLEGKNLENFEAALMTKTGRKLFVRVSANCRFENGRVAQTRCILHDVTQLKETEDVLREQATRDPLTNLYNRRYMLEQISLQHETSKRYGHKYCLCICDLDKFKEVNDTYGHHSGDEALLFFGKLLGRKLRSIDIVGRYGGDEFLVLFPHITAAEAHIALTRVQEVMQGTSFLSHDGRKFHITTTYGIVEDDGSFESVEALLVAADQALYAGKSKGRNRIEVSAPTH